MLPLTPRAVSYLTLNTLNAPERASFALPRAIAPAEIDEIDEAALQKLGYVSEGGAQTLISISRHREIAGDRARSRSAFRGPEA